MFRKNEEQRHENPPPKTPINPRRPSNAPLKKPRPQNPIKTAPQIKISNIKNRLSLRSHKTIKQSLNLPHSPNKTAETFSALGHIPKKSASVPIVQT